MQNLLPRRRRTAMPPANGAHPSLAARLPTRLPTCLCTAALLLLTAVLLIASTAGRSSGQRQFSCPWPSADVPRIQRLQYAAGSSGNSSDASDGCGAAAGCEDRYTMVINSFHRHDLLQASIAHYAACAELDAIRVSWSEDTTGPPPEADAPAYYSSKKEVRYDVQPTPSLNNRFRPPPGLRTLAVLSIDDDVIVPCHEVAATFIVWRQHPDRMVGWFPRGHAVRRGCRFDYLLRDAAVLLRGSYSMVLTKGAFLHRDWLATYAAAAPPAMLAYIDAHRNCEDIAMSMIVANATGGVPPIYDRAPSLRDLGQGLMKVKGISSLGGHAGERSACLNEFACMLGGMPLVSRRLSEHRRPWLLRLSTIWDRTVL